MTWTSVRGIRRLAGAIVTVDAFNEQEERGEGVPLISGYIQAAVSPENDSRIPEDEILI
jgi:hypothetical protein